MVEVKQIQGDQLEEFIKTEKKVLVDYFETNCGPCKMMDMVLKEIAKSTENITIVKLEYNKNRDIAEKYDVNNTPYLILFKNGQEVGRLIGLKQKTVIQQFIE